MKKAIIIILITLVALTLVPVYAFADGSSTAGDDRAMLYGLEEESDDEFVPAEGDRLLGDIFENSGVTEEEPSKNTQEPSSEEKNTPSQNVTEPESTFENTQEAQPAPSENNANDSSLQNDNTQNNISLQEEWAEGSIGIEFGWIRPDVTRTSMQYPAGGFYGWGSLPYWSSGSAALIDSSGQIVESFTGESSHKFENLKAGTYKLRLTVLERGMYSVFDSISSLAGLIREADLDEQNEITVEVTEGNTSTTWRYVVIEYKAYGFKTKTNIGTFSNGTRENEYYKGGNWAYPNTDPSSSGRSKTFNTHSGIYYGDSASLYNLNVLEEPVLSDEEAARGYRFLGWRLVSGEGDKEKIYREPEALNYIVRSDTVFEAVWNRPEHTVSYSTSKEFGTIVDGNPSLSYKYLHGETVSDIPEVVPKAGYEFIGWFNDLTVNVIPNEEIKETVVDKDINYYAKYRRKTAKYTVKYLPGTDGALKGTDTLLLKENSFIPTIPTVEPKEGYEHTGKWKVTAVSDDCDLLKVGDVLNEIQISRLQISFDVNLEALYKSQTEPESTKEAEQPTTPQQEDPTKPAEPTKPQEEPTKPQEEPTKPADPTTPPATAAPASSNGTKGGKTSPQTADTSNLPLWAGIMVTGLFALGFAGIGIVKRNRKSNNR